ncbi:hypothetical protein JAAARDRAFT_28605 [Jaapia argillacea MUCL 33604]|uniref:Glycoside hydrolase family 105 protein n=1 Tax=Jaapia argillacea MUCL 33604 TaxID=933084 RepID=A0A067QD29_9AGAM|nr:hypothetical protein JAAARDRAFT_28605 [Jaapia argillacea MUCL 33604]
MDPPTLRSTLAHGGWTLVAILYNCKDFIINYVTPYAAMLIYAVISTNLDGKNQTSRQSWGYQNVSTGNTHLVLRETYIHHDVWCTPPNCPAETLVAIDDQYWQPSAARELYSPPIQAGFDNVTIANVRARLLEIAQASWEVGTAAEALTELSWPALSVFRPTAFPPPTHLNATLNATDVLAIANETVQSKPAGTLPLVGGTGVAAGDPASLGVAVLLANWTRTNLSDLSYASAATDELTFLLNDVPRTNDGAISHQTDQVQLWADFIYMAPPFIAYYGILAGGTQELSLLQEAYTQCMLYRNYLKDDGGLWRHVVLGTWQDNTHWATGNGWAAAGMLRVLETIHFSSQASSLVDEQRNLTKWIEEIINGTWIHQQDNGTLLNTIDDPTSFADSSGTALLASVTYRMAGLTNNTDYVGYANRAMKLIENSLDADGWLLNTVDPYVFNAPVSNGTHSPEGQAFVILLHTAWRDFANYITLPSAGGWNSTIPGTTPSGSSQSNPGGLKCQLRIRT